MSSQASSSSSPQSREPQLSRLAPDQTPPPPSAPSRPASSGTGYLDVLSGAVKNGSQRLTTGRMPCARESFLYGLATLAGVTGVGAVAGRGLLRSMHWGVGGGIVVTLTNR